jgi:hypothetical protein
MIYGTGSDHVGFKFNGLSIRAGMEHLPIIAISALVAMWQRYHMIKHWIIARFHT